MNYFGDIFKKNRKSMLQENDNFINQNDELSRLKFEAIATLEETQALKRIIQPAIKKFVEEIEQQGAKPEKFYQAVIPPEMVEGMKNGKFKFMEANDGSLLPNIVDTKNKIVKKVRIEEMELSPQNLNSVNQLSDKLLNQKLDAISDQLGVIMELAIEINKQLKNNNYAKVIGAIQTINQSYLEKGRNTRQQLQNNAQGLLNEASAVLKLEIEDALQYFKDWDKRMPLLNQYSSVQIQNRLNNLMKDYLYFTNANSALIDLKRKQGLNDEVLRLMTHDSKEIDSQLRDVGIRSWLPPQTNKNKWQHELFSQMELNYGPIIIEYKLDELLEERSEIVND